MADCGPYDGDLTQAWLDGAWMEAVVCPYDLQLGSLTFGLIIYGTIAIGLYVRTGSFVVPLTLTALVGTVAVSRIPSQAHQIAGLAIILGVTGAAWLLYHKTQTVS